MRRRSSPWKDGYLSFTGQDAFEGCLTGRLFLSVASVPALDGDCCLVHLLNEPSNTQQNYYYSPRTREQAEQTGTSAWLSDLSASSSVTSLLRGRTGSSRWADTGDLLLEVEETEEKFFWDFVREPLSWGASSFAVALRMLLKERCG